MLVAFRRSSPPPTCAAAARSRALHGCAAKPCTSPEQESAAKRSGAREGAVRRRHAHVRFTGARRSRARPRAGKRSEAERCEGRGCAAAARSRPLHRCAAKPRTSPSRKAQRSGAVRGKGPRGGGTLTCASQVRGEAARVPEQESAAKRSGARDDSAHPKVLQRFALPVWKPVENQCVRSAEEPCVHVSGLTCPCVACWMRSSPTAAAALSASFTSASVIFVR